MPRLREVPRAEVTDERILCFYDRLFAPDRDPAVDHGTSTGSPGDWWTVFAQSPDVFRHAVRGFALYRNAALDPVLRELGQCRAGWARGSQFVFSQHCKQMRALGMPEETDPVHPALADGRLLLAAGTGRPGLHRRARPGRRPGATTRSSHGSSSTFPTGRSCSSPTSPACTTCMRRWRGRCGWSSTTVPSPLSRWPRPRATATVISRTTSPGRADPAAWDRQARLPALSNIVPVPEPAAVRVRS